jgi:hypothetical protein
LHKPLNFIRRVVMKKIFCLIGLGMFLISACATVPRTPLQPSEAGILKGEWEGIRAVQWVRFTSQDYTTMEIFNDVLPLKGKVSVRFLEGQNLYVYSFDNGTIDAEGKLVANSGEEMKISLGLYHEKGKMKLYGDYYYRQNYGTLTLYKK